MTDRFQQKKRSQIMASVKGRNTAPERLVKSCLRRLHCRYRSNVKGLPGTPDIVLVGQKKLIFVHGCFWHGHKGCPRGARPDTNRSFWDRKIDGNMRRDAKTRCSLTRLGWRVLILWQCETRNLERMNAKLVRFINAA
ncbi:MAG: DNA mismatch endonuclease Vsr [Verrucomicrobia bacterium]|nr:DNA mismatch endonuclease Vsr [Verrucomicrobiota bacterium]NMD20890.1 DNA mismatch endonuclease Vsr [Verrucomicrobiota bacterium]